MTKLIIKLFIKNNQDVNDVSVRSKYGRLSGIIGIISNLILTIIKLVAGIIAGSIAIIADGINNLSDVSTSVVTLLGFRLSSIPADKEHPYGHQRIEYIAGLIVSIFVLIVGLGLLQTSVEKIIKPEPIIYSNLILGILIISILIKLWQMFFYRKVSRIISSKTLFAASFDSLSDTIATIIVLAGMIILKLTNVNIDGYLGLIISLFIIINGIKLIKETISPLLGEAPSEEFLEKIEEHLNSYDNILGYHDIIVHNYGPLRTFVTVDVEMDSRLEMVVAHAIVDQIEYDFRKKGLGNLVVHVDPVDIQCEKLSRYRQMIGEILHNIDHDLRYHDVRLGIGKNKMNLMFDVVVPFENNIDCEKLKQEIIEKIKDQEPQLKPLITIDRSDIL